MELLTWKQGDCEREAWASYIGPFKLKLHLYIWFELRKSKLRGSEGKVRSRSSSGSIWVLVEESERKSKAFGRTDDNRMSLYTPFHALAVLSSTRLHRSLFTCFTLWANKASLCMQHQMFSRQLCVWPRLCVCPSSIVLDDKQSNFLYRYGKEVCRVCSAGITTATCVAWAICDRVSISFPLCMHVCSCKRVRVFLWICAFVFVGARVWIYVYVWVFLSHR